MTTKEGITVTEVADELGISPQHPSKWRSELIDEGELENAGKRLDALEENRRLHEELKQLKTENEILKKAASYFASRK
jgi:transposase